MPLNTGRFSIVVRSTLNAVVAAITGRQNALKQRDQTTYLKSAPLIVID